MPSVAAVATQLATANRPVIFLDTCVLLDVVRAIKRLKAQCVEKARELHNAVSVPPEQCSMVVSHLVHHEWTINVPQVLDEANRHLNEIEQQSSHFQIACAVFGLAPGFGPAKYAAHGMAELLRDLAQNLLACGIEIDADDECSGRAIHRVIYNIPPSKKGGEAKDCTILEQYLAVCRQLHADGFAKRRVFCTSNKNDFCETGGGLHPALAADFVAVDLRFTSNLPWGLYDVTH